MPDDVGLHVGDINAVIEMTIKGNDGLAEDISTASTKQIKLTKPAGSNITKNAEFTTNGSDGKLRYTTIANDLNEHGTWGARVYLVLGSGWDGHSSKTLFKVYPV